MMKDGAERRRYPRSRRGITMMTDESAPGILNHVDNISANGVLCHTIKPIPLMTRIAVALDLPKPIDRRIDAEGVVVRCDPDEQGDDHFRVAILFTRLDEQDYEAISDFVAQDLAEMLRDA